MMGHVNMDCVQHYDYNLKNLIQCTRRPADVVCCQQLLRSDFNILLFILLDRWFDIFSHTLNKLLSCFFEGHNNGKYKMLQYYI